MKCDLHGATCDAGACNGHKARYHGQNGQLPLKVELRMMIKLVPHIAQGPLFIRIYNRVCSMASILSLPDELIEIIGTHVMRATFREPEDMAVVAWCRLTSTCRRLWSLQLPQSHRGMTYPVRLDMDKGQLHRSQMRA